MARATLFLSAAALLFSSLAFGQATITQTIVNPDLTNWTGIVTLNRQSSILVGNTYSISNSIRVVVPSTGIFSKALQPGIYRVVYQPSTNGNPYWVVPASGTHLITDVEIPAPPISGTYCLQSINGIFSYISGTCQSPGGISWSTFTASQWASLTSSQWSTLTQ